MSRISDDLVWERWQALMNVPADDLEAWLDTPQSWSVGFKGHGEESVGHASGRRNLALLGKERDELGPEDWRQVRRTVGFIRRHLAQRPEGDVEDTRWRWSLLNWGHDPLGDVHV